MGTPQQAHQEKDVEHDDNAGFQTLPVRAKMVQKQGPYPEKKEFLGSQMLALLNKKNAAKIDET